MIHRLRHWEPNPVVIKELRSRMRGGRSFIIITVSLILMAVVNYALYRMTIASQQYSTSPVSPQVGQMLFTGLAFFELLIIAAVTPAITAGEISSEREKQTYEMLMTTPLSTASNLWGKLFSATSYILLVIFAAIPMASLVFIYGGVTIRDMLKTLVALVVIALLFGVISLFCSAAFKRTGSATVASYLAIGLLIFGPFFAALVYSTLHQSDPPRYLLAPSPVTVLASTFEKSVNAQTISSAFWMIGSPIYWLLGNQPVSQTSIPRPVYHYGLPLYILLAMVLYMVTTRLVKPVHRWKVSWSEAAVALVLLLGFLGITSLGYLATTNRYENIRIVAPGTTAPVIGPIPAVEPALTVPDLPQPVPQNLEPAPKGAIPNPIATG